MFGPRHEHRLARILAEISRVRPGGRVLDAHVDTDFATAITDSLAAIRAVTALPTPTTTSDKKATS